MVMHINGYQKIHYSIVYLTERSIGIKLVAYFQENKKPGGYVNMKTVSKGVSIFSVIALLIGVLLPAGAFANELESIADIKTVVGDVYFENNIISPNGDDRFDEAVLKVGLKKKVSLNAEVWDAMNPSGGDFKDGTIGYLLRLGYQGPGEYDLRTNGYYIRWGYPDPNLLFLTDFRKKSPFSSV